MDALRAQGIHSVLTTFTDLPGGPKGKLVPLDGLPGAVSSGAGFSGPSISGTGLPRMGARSEYMGRVVPESLRPLPFAGGEPLDTCSRQVLKRQIERLKARGWRLWVGIEPEFFLLNRNNQGRWQVADALDGLAKPSYDLQAIGRNFAFLDAMRQTLTALGFGLQQIDHEDACGQYEINYQHDDALAAADRYQLFKLAAQAVAAQHGAVFSTMPKPLAHAPGSGLHFHLSLTDANGQAVMAEANGALGLSSIGHQFAAGLLHHADALAALCAPTVNSYKRLAASRSASGTTWSASCAPWPAASNGACPIRRATCTPPSPPRWLRGSPALSRRCLPSRLAPTICMRCMRAVKPCPSGCRATCSPRCRRWSKTRRCEALWVNRFAPNFSRSSTPNGPATASK